MSVGLLSFAALMSSNGCSRYQSGEIDWSGRISRCGDEMMRVMLYEAAQSMLRSKKWSWLKAGPCRSPGAEG
jgi:transposase